MVKKIIIVLIVALIAVAFVFGWQYYQKNKVEAKEFVGQVTDIGQNYFVLDGIYFVSGEQAAKIRLDSRTVKIYVNDKTIFSEIKTKIPSLEELKSTGGSYKLSDLKKEKIAGSFSIFADQKSSIGSVYVKSKENIYNKGSFMAGAVDFETIATP